MCTLLPIVMLLSEAASSLRHVMVRKSQRRPFGQPLSNSAGRPIRLLCLIAHLDQLHFLAVQDCLKQFERSLDAVDRKLGVRDVFYHSL